MLVKDWMTREPLVLSPKDTIDKAFLTMRENRVRHLPVIKKGNKLVGIVSQQDLLQVSPSPATSLSVWEVSFLLARLRVDDVMHREVIVVGEDCPLEAAALVMAEHKIGCLPVVRGKELVGIITETDLFSIFTGLLGARHTGVRLTASVENEKGQLARLSGRLSELGANIVSLTTMPSKQEDHYVVTLKVEGLTLDELRKAVSPVVIEVLDIREGRGWQTEGFRPYHWTLTE